MKLFVALVTIIVVCHADQYLFLGQRLDHTVALTENMTRIHQLVLKIWQNDWTMKYRSL